MIKKLLIVFMFNSLSFAIENITNADIGTYSLLDAKMQSSQMLMHLGKNNNTWVVYGKDTNASNWRNISCDAGCDYRDSTKEELDIYLNYILDDSKNKFEIACIQNKVNAFCKFPKKNTNSQFYALVTFVTGRPIPIFLKKLNMNEKPYK